MSRSFKKSRHELLFAVLTLSLLFAGCGDMLRSLRQESLAIDETERDREAGEEDVVASAPRPLRGATANNVEAYDPPVKRSYSRRLASTLNEARGEAEDDVKTTASGYKRYTKADFVDSNPNENSLWNGSGQNNFYFTQNRQREVGDLVTVDVERGLRRDIQYALWNTLPAEQRKKPRAPASVNGPADKTKGAQQAPAAAAAAAGAKNAVENAKDQAEEAAKTNLASNGKEDDVVRMEVVEHLGNGLVRLVGQKRVIYKGQPKTLEVMALVNNRDIDDQNRLKSTAILDSNTQVIQ